MLYWGSDPSPPGHVPWDNAPSTEPPQLGSLYIFSEQRQSHSIEAPRPVPPAPARCRREVPAIKAPPSLGRRRPVSGGPPGHQRGCSQAGVTQTRPTGAGRMLVFPSQKAGCSGASMAHAQTGQWRPGAGYSTHGVPPRRPTLGPVSALGLGLLPHPGWTRRDRRRLFPTTTPQLPRRQPSRAWQEPLSLGLQGHPLPPFLQNPPISHRVLPPFYPYNINVDRKGAFESLL